MQKRMQTSRRKSWLSISLCKAFFSFSLLVAYHFNGYRDFQVLDIIGVQSALTLFKMSLAEWRAALAECYKPGGERDGTTIYLLMVFFFLSMISFSSSKLLSICSEVPCKWRSKMVVLSKQSSYFAGERAQ